MVDRNALLVGLVTGLFPVTVLSVDGYWNPLLALFVWFSWTLVGWLIVGRMDGVRGSQWSALHVLLVVGGAMFGVNMELPISESLTIALWFLVIGIGWAAMLIGVQIGREGTDDAANPTETLAG